MKISDGVCTPAGALKTTGTVRTSALDWLSLALVVIGAINWGLVGVGTFLDANWNAVNILFGSIPELEALVYVLVGLAGLWEIVFAYRLYSARTTESTSTERAR